MQGPNFFYISTIEAKSNKVKKKKSLLAPAALAAPMIIKSEWPKEVNFRWRGVFIHFLEVYQVLGRKKCRRKAISEFTRVRGERVKIV